MQPRAVPAVAHTYTLDVHGPQETVTLVFFKTLTLGNLLARLRQAFTSTLWSQFTLTWESEDDVIQAFEVTHTPAEALPACCWCTACTRHIDVHITQL